jgi:hypothetical protein
MTQVDEWNESVRKACHRYGVSAACTEGLALYITHGIEPGSFLSAVLTNDLMGALGRADDQNVRLLREYGMILYNDSPSGCYGSPERFAAWIKAGGLNGMALSRMAAE